MGKELPISDLERRHLEYLRELCRLDGDIKTLQRDFDEPGSDEFMVG